MAKVSQSISSEVLGKRLRRVSENKKREKLIKFMLA